MIVHSNQYTVIRKNGGFSLVEILIVISLFVVVSLIVGQALFSTIKGSTKSDLTIKVRQNGNYALSVMERMLHSATSISCTSQLITYRDSNGADSALECKNNSIYLNNNSLLPSDVYASCSFTCPLEGGTTTVNISAIFTQVPASGQTVQEKISVPLQTKVRLRN